MIPEKPFLTAQWRSLLMLNYQVDPALLRPYLPAGTELDTWQGMTLVSLVGFLFLDTRLLGVPIPFHRNFEEVNLRFYVRHLAGDEWRRGVVFVREIVPRPAIAFLARWVYNERYVSCPMRSVVNLPREGQAGRVEYTWKLGGAWHSLAAELVGEPLLPEPGSEAEFITEHYWGYARQRNGTTLEYRVAHPQWPVWRTAAARFEGDVETVYGSQFAPFLHAEPTSAFVAEGSEVMVYWGVATGD